jgi:hypothetical protein
MRIRRNLATTLLASGLLANSVAVGFAEPAIIEIASVQAGHDQRTGNPVLSLRLGSISKADLWYRRLGKTTDFRVNGRVISSPVIREPLLFPNIQLSGSNWTDETVRKIAEECTQPGAKCEVVIPDAD